MNEQLRQLGEQYWDYTLERQPTQALMLGDHRYDDRFEDMSRQAEDAVIGRLREFAAEAETIDVDGRLVAPGFVETHIHLDKSCILDRCRG